MDIDIILISLPDLSVQNRSQRISLDASSREREMLCTKEVSKFTGQKLQNPCAHEFYIEPESFWLSCSSRPISRSDCPWSLNDWHLLPYQNHFLNEFEEEAREHGPYFSSWLTKWLPTNELIQMRTERTVLQQHLLRRVYPALPNSGAPHLSRIRKHGRLSLQEILFSAFPILGFAIAHFPSSIIMGATIDLNRFGITWRKHTRFSQELPSIPGVEVVVIEIDCLTSTPTLLLAVWLMYSATLRPTELLSPVTSTLKASSTDNSSQSIRRDVKSMSSSKPLRPSPYFLRFQH